MRHRTPFALGLVVAILVRVGWCGETPDSKPELRTAAGVAVQYYLSLPRSWTADSTWPILVTIDGSGHNFAGNCQSFTKARGAQPFILVTPCVSSNGNDPADLKAVLAIVEEVQKLYKGQPKFFITGFSAGGHLAWQCIFTHPELLAGAALAAGNFRFRGVANISKSPERVKLPIQEFLGDKDGIKAPLTQQWEDASKLAKEHGYEALVLTEVPGAGHQPFPDKVLAFFGFLLQKKSE
ncbi:MAG TPA: hypothetical protein VGP72_18645 [Planctomycetota bacterium]|jgi:poly(3-hydroxybutyrate) depolymerase